MLLVTQVREKGILPPEEVSLDTRKFSVRLRTVLRLYSGIVQQSAAQMPVFAQHAARVYLPGPKDSIFLKKRLGECRSVNAAQSLAGCQAPES